MHRCLVIVLPLFWMATAGQVSAWHFHSYAGHDHPDHHHGLAAHDHHLRPSQQAEDEVTLESCDPGQHVVSVVLACAVSPQSHVASDIAPAPTTLARLVPLRLGHDVTDVRVHGPPRLARTPPRGPPPIFLA